MKIERSCLDNNRYIGCYYSSCKKLSLQLTWYYRNIILQRINSVVVLCTRIVLLLESLLCWWAELRTMLRHLNRRGLNGITCALLTVYKLHYYMTINILDSDWTTHYFTLYFKMWWSLLKSAREVNITFEHCSVYPKIVAGNVQVAYVFSNWSIFKEAVVLSNQRFPNNSL